MNTIFSPSHCLTEVVGAGNKAVVSTRKIGKPSHLILFPNKSEVDKTGGERPGIESCATPSLAERLRVGGLRDTDDDALSIFHVPCDTTVWSPQCAKVRERTAAP